MYPREYFETFSRLEIGLAHALRQSREVGASIVGVASKEAILSKLKPVTAAV